MVLFAWKTYQVAAITSGGPDQDLTISGIGTPVAAIIEVTRVTSSPGSVDHLCVSYGITDMVTSVAAGIRSEDNLGTTDTGRMLWSAGIVNVETSASDAADGLAVFKEVITDGIRITWTNFLAGAYILTVTFIYGDLAQAYLALYTTGGVVDDIEPLSGAGFDPNLSMFWWFRAGWADPASSNNNNFCHHGMAVDNEGTVEQLAFGFSDRDNRSVSHGWGLGIRDDCVLQDITQSAAGSATFGGRLAVVDFITGTGGCNVQTLDSAISFAVAVLHIKTGDNRRTIKIVDSNSATSGASASTKITTGWPAKLVRSIACNLNA